MKAKMTVKTKRKSKPVLCRQKFLCPMDPVLYANGKRNLYKEIFNYIKKNGEVLVIDAAKDFGVSRDIMGPMFSGLKSKKYIDLAGKKVVNGDTKHPQHLYSATRLGLMNYEKIGEVGTFVHL